MSKTHLCRVVAGVALTVLTTAGCAVDGADDRDVAAAPTPSTPPAASSLSASPSIVQTPMATAEPSSDQAFDIDAAGGQVTGDTGRLKVSVGQSVTLRVTSDTADEVHLHGYDLKATVAPGQPAEITFDATIPGVFEIELENSGTALASLQVS